jgi:hypothetical protein
MGFIFKKRTCFYYTKKVFDGEKWVLGKSRRATKEEIEIYLEQRHQEFCPVICDNPFCDTIFYISRGDKILLNLSNPKEKLSFEWKYCSSECQARHQTALCRRT